MSLQLLIIH